MTIATLLFVFNWGTDIAKFQHLAGLGNIFSCLLGGLIGFFPCSKDIVAISLLHLQRLGGFYFQNGSPNSHPNGNQLLQMKTQYSATYNLLSRLFVPFANGSSSICIPAFFKCFLDLEV